MQKAGYSFCFHLPEILLFQHFMEKLIQDTFICSRMKKCECKKLIFNITTFYYNNVLGFL